MSYHIENRATPVGILCSSTDMELLSDFGISIDSGNITSALATGDQEHAFSVATGIASYPLSLIKIDAHFLYMADVDCDEANGAVYRATSTCNVAMMPLGNGRFLYGNFTIENHTGSSHGTTKEDVLALWNDLEVEK